MSWWCAMGKNKTLQLHRDNGGMTTQHCSVILSLVLVWLHGFYVVSSWVPLNCIGKILKSTVLSVQEVYFIVQLTLDISATSACHCPAGSWWWLEGWFGHCQKRNGWAKRSLDYYSDGRHIVDTNSDFKQAVLWANIGEQNKGNLCLFSVNAIHRTAQQL